MAILLFYNQANGIFSSDRSEDGHLPCWTGAWLGRVASLFEVIRFSIGSEEREPVPQDGVDHVRAAGIAAEAFAEVAVDEVVDDGVHGLGGEQLVDGGLDSHRAGVAGHLNLFWGGAKRCTHPLTRGIIITRPEIESNSFPELWKAGLTLGDVFCRWAKTSNKDGLLVCNALIGHKAIGEDGDDGEQGGTDEERLHLLLGEFAQLPC